MNKGYIKDIEARKRFFWIKEAQRLGVNRACLKLGIYKSHYYYWKKRYDRFGVEGLSNRSRKPRRSPRLSGRKLVRRVLAVRADTDRGADTISWLLHERYGLRVPRSTVHKILRRTGCIEQRKKKPRSKHVLRYAAKTPGERVQIDVKYVPYRIKDGTWGRAYQYTAIDDCTRARFALIYEGHGVCYLQDFLERMRAFFPFAVQLIQTDNDAVFTNKYTAAQAFKQPPKEHWMARYCKEHGISHYLIAPGTPELNGKVERSHRTDQMHFYDFHFFKWITPLQKRFAIWIDFYNHRRPHWALGGQSPAQRLQAFGYKLGRISNAKKIKYSFAA
jgi:transposase InsO family protein